MIAKIAAAGDSVTTRLGSGNVVNFSNTYSPNIFALNQSGQVAFGGQITIAAASHNGFFAGSAGGPVSAIVLNGDTIDQPNQPVGLAGLLFPEYLSSFNDAGVLTSASFLTNNGAVIQGTAGGTPVAAAYTGESVPGGTLALSASVSIAGVNFIFDNNDALGNDENDVAVRGTFSGIGGSAFLLVRGTGSQPGVLQSPILQGNAVPGAGGTFSPILPNSNFALGPDG
jgi:hypothetical protein